MTERARTAARSLGVSYKYEAVVVGAFMLDWWDALCSTIGHLPLEADDKGDRNHGRLFVSAADSATKEDA